MKSIGLSNRSSATGRRQAIWAPATAPRQLAGLLGVLVLGMALASGPALAAKKAPAASGPADQDYVLVQLNGEPLATYERTRPPKGKKIDFTSNTARAYRAQLSNLRNDYKAWLRKNVPGAKVTGEFDIALNAVGVKLNGATLDQVAASPLVRFAQYQGVYYKNNAGADPDLALIYATEAWSRDGGAATAGEGVKVAIVDSGIDVTHSCFDDTGYPVQQQLGDKKYTNNKVIAARVFNNQVNRNGFDAEAVDDHGTHVAGTTACNYQTPTNVDGVAVPYAMSGVAPRALLGNYNVFPGTIDNARSEDILNALEAAYADGFDVANMSLGGGSSGVQDLLTIAVDNLDEADMVVAISNGNEGPGLFTVGSPGMAERGLTAGASSVPHFVGAPVTVENVGSYGAAAGDFATVLSDTTAPLYVVQGSVNGLDNACAPISGVPSGSIALISRGSCTFSTKIRNAQNAGAIAVLVGNNVAGDPTAMGSDGTADQPTVPAYMVSLDVVPSLVDATDKITTIGASLAYYATQNANVMAGFSSQGPTDVRFRVKPDVVAPGVNVLSSLPHGYCDQPPCFGFKSGTSMAAPHLAGSAAVVRGQHPDWSAAEVRSAIVNTAQTNVLISYNNPNPEPEPDITDATVVGAGLENLEAAVNAEVALNPVSLAFGGVPAGSGQSRTLELELTNLRDDSASFELAVTDQPASVEYSVTPNEVSLGAGESAVVEVTMSAPKGASGLTQQGTLAVSEGGTEVAHAVLFTLVK